MTTALRVPGIPRGESSEENFIEIRQEELKGEVDASKYMRLFEQHKIGIEYWF
jgi:hypothetical protein